MKMVFDEEGERKSLIAQLGLKDGATDEVLAAAVAERLKRQEEEEEDDLEVGDDDAVIVDVAEFTRLRSRDKVANEVEKAMAIRDRDELIEEAVHEGKISPGRREHYKAKYDGDPEGTKKLLARLTKKTVPLEILGKDAPTDEVDQSSYDPNWLPEVAARQADADPNKPKRSRVHGEV